MVGSPIHDNIDMSYYDREGFSNGTLSIYTNQIIAYLFVFIALPN